MPTYTLSPNEKYTLADGNEQDFSPNLPAFVKNSEVEAAIIVDNGPIQFAVGEAVASKHKSWATGDKLIVTFGNLANNTLRAKGNAGAFTASW